MVLFSPLVSLIPALATCSPARIDFRFFLEADKVEGGQSNLLDETVEVLHSQLLIFTGASSTPDWPRSRTTLPPAAIGRSIRLEFGFLSDGSEPNGAGWYLDGVSVRRESPRGTPRAYGFESGS
ncbi:MAG: hypothetical protein AAF514_07820 [Verrucomicrobiota bacterium]